MLAALYIHSQKNHIGRHRMEKTKLGIGFFKTFHGTVQLGVRSIFVSLHLQNHLVKNCQMWNPICNSFEQK